MRLGEYLFSAFLICAAISVISYLSYSRTSDKALRGVMAILLLYVLILPISTLSSEIFNLDISSYPSVDSIGENLTAEGAEEAFSDGIRSLVVERYNIAEKNVSVKLYGFDFYNMRAERVSVFLSGAGVLIDSRGLEEYLNSLGLGECEVELLID